MFLTVKRSFLSGAQLFLTVKYIFLGVKHFLIRDIHKEILQEETLSVEKALLKNKKTPQSLWRSTEFSFRFIIAYFLFFTCSNSAANLRAISGWSLITLFFS